LAASRELQCSYTSSASAYWAVFDNFRFAINGTQILDAELELGQSTAATLEGYKLK
jgi:hypothetical protein